eukprot:6473053-Amphidinium_carterae.1
MSGFALISTTLLLRPYCLGPASTLSWLACDGGVVIGGSGSSTVTSARASLPVKEWVTPSSSSSSLSSSSGSMISSSDVACTLLHVALFLIPPAGIISLSRRIILGIWGYMLGVGRILALTATELLFLTSRTIGCSCSRRCRRIAMRLRTVSQIPEDDEHEPVVMMTPAVGAKPRFLTLTEVYRRQSLKVGGCNGQRSPCQVSRACAKRTWPGKFAAAVAFALVCFVILSVTQLIAFFVEYQGFVSYRAMTEVTWLSWIYGKFLDGFCPSLQFVAHVGVNSVIASLQVIGEKGFEGFIMAMGFFQVTAENGFANVNIVSQPVRGVMYLLVAIFASCPLLCLFLVKSYQMLCTLLTRDRTVSGQGTTGACSFRQQLSKCCSCARWGGRRRFCAIRYRYRQVVYNPRSSGHCLWASAQFLIKAQHGVDIPHRRLRQLVAAEYTRMRFSPDIKDQQMLQAIAVRYMRNMHMVQGEVTVSDEMMDDFVRRTASSRWGSTDDLAVIRSLMNSAGVAFEPVVVDGELGNKLLMGEKVTKGLHMVYWNRHFFVARQGALRRCSQPIVNSNAVVGDGDGCRVAGAKRGRRYPAGAHQIVMSFHGSFSPFHPGHAAVLRSARAMMVEQGFSVKLSVIGFTRPDQLEKKNKSALWADVGKRADVAEAVLKDANMSEVLVDRTPHGSSGACAAAHAKWPVYPIYVVGADVMMRPSDSTIVVLRAGFRAAPVHFSWHDWSGVCPQDDCHGLSATLVRQCLSRGSLPALFGQHGRAAVQKYCTAPLAVETVGEELCPDEEQQGADQPQDRPPTDFRHGRASQWTPQEQLATYGAGYRILKNLGGDQGPAPLIGVKRLRQVGIQDNEANAVDYRAMKRMDIKPRQLSCTQAGSSTDPVPAQGPGVARPAADISPLPKAMPKRQLPPAGVAPTFPVRPAPMRENQPDAAADVEVVVAQQAQPIQVEASASETDGEDVPTHSSSEESWQAYGIETTMFTRLQHIILTMDGAREGFDRDPEFLNNHPDLKELLLQHAREVVGEGVQMEELCTALTLLPTRGIKLCRGDRTFRELLLRRVSADIEAHHRAEQMLAGQMTLERWFFLLLQDRATKDGSNFAVALDWLYAGLATYIVTAGVLVEEELRAAFQAGPARQLSTPTEMLEIVKAMILDKEQNHLTQDESHLRGCACPCRQFTVPTKVSFQPKRAWRASDVVNQVVPLLETLWSAKRTVLTMEKGRWILSMNCAREPACLLPVTRCSPRVEALATDILESTGFECVELSAEEIPAVPGRHADVYYAMMMRRRAISFPHPVGVLARANGSSVFVCKTPDSTPACTRRYPGIVDLEDFSNITFPFSTMDEAMGAVQVRAGGGCGSPDLIKCTA